MPNSIAQIEVFNDGVFALDDHAHRSGYKSAACKVRERRPANVALTFMPINPTWREADISISPRDVRFTPESGHWLAARPSSSGPTYFARLLAEREIAR